MIGKKCWVPEFPAGNDFSPIEKDYIAFEKEFGLSRSDIADIRTIKLALQSAFHLRAGDAIAKAFEIYAAETHRLSNKQVRAIANYYRRKHFHYPAHEARHIYYEEIHEEED